MYVTDGIRLYEGLGEIEHLSDSIRIRLQDYIFSTMPHGYVVALGGGGLISTSQKSFKLTCIDLYYTCFGCYDTTNRGFADSRMGKIYQNNISG